MQSLTLDSSLRWNDRMAVCASPLPGGEGQGEGMTARRLAPHRAQATAFATLSRRERVYGGANA